MAANMGQGGAGSGTLVPAYPTGQVPRITHCVPPSANDATMARTLVPNPDRTMYRLRSCLLLCTAALWMACADDPNLDPPVTDAGGDAGGSGDVSVEPDAGQQDAATGCIEGEPIIDGDACDCDGESRDASDELCERTCECAGGFWSCDEVCDEPEPLALRFDGAPVLVQSVGNDDALIQRGETWLVRVDVAADNAGDVGAEVLVRLQTDDIFLELPAETSRVGLTGLTGEAQTVELAFVVDAAAPEGETQLTLEATSGFAVQTEAVRITISGPNAPALAWGDVEFERIEGDPDRQVEPGERWQLIAMLRNDGDRDAEELVLSATASSAAIVLDETAFGPPQQVSAGTSTSVRWRFDVADELIELEPEVQLLAEATGAAGARADIAVPLVPPDTLAVVATRWSGVPPDLTLEVDVENAGALDVVGLEWTRINYASPTPCGDGDEEPACEIPFLESLDLGEPSGPSIIAAGMTGTVELSLTRTGLTPELGRVLLRASSALRQHGPYPVDVDVPME